MEIELLDSTNRSRLDRIAPDVFDDSIVEASLNDFINCPRHALALAVDEDVVIGMASGFEYFHPDKTRQFFIAEVGVTPEYRNQGIGRCLVQRLIDHARDRGCCYAWL
ncbi:MAG: GNAT family N-acetyltransferase, partial [Pirellulaceae bacterium]|nr:GNAT family N-acetyltransferase [Pirellulaceae bacterium]